MGKEWAVLFLLVMGTAVYAEDLMCSVAAERSTDTYDYLLQHVPQLENDIKALQSRGEFNQTQLMKEMNSDFAQQDESIKAYIQGELDKKFLSDIAGVALGVVLGCGIAFSIQNWGGGDGQ